MPLRLRRKVGETVRVGDMKITVKRIKYGSYVDLAFDGPDDIRVLRQEILDRDPTALVRNNPSDGPVMPSSAPAENASSS